MSIACSVTTRPTPRASSSGARVNRCRVDRASLSSRTATTTSILWALAPLRGHSGPAASPWRQRRYGRRIPPPSTLERRHTLVAPRVGAPLIDRWWRLSRRSQHVSPSVLLSGAQHGSYSLVGARIVPRHVVPHGAHGCGKNPGDASYRTRRGAPKNWRAISESVALDERSLSVAFSPYYFGRPGWRGVAWSTAEVLPSIPP